MGIIGRIGRAIRNAGRALIGKPSVEIEEKTFVEGMIKNLQRQKRAKDREIVIETAKQMTPKKEKLIESAGRKAEQIITERLARLENKFGLSAHTESKQRYRWVCMVTVEYEDTEEEEVFGYTFVSNQLYRNDEVKKIVAEELQNYKYSIKKIEIPHKTIDRKYKAWR